MDATTILDEIARTGYEGTQLGNGFPEGAELRDELARRDLRLAEVYVPLPATVDGPTAGAMDVAIERIRLLHDGGGEVLCVALTGRRVAMSWRVAPTTPGTPVLTDAGWDALIDLLHDIADAAARSATRRVPSARARRSSRRRRRSTGSSPRPIPSRIGICLDVGHHLVGGGDPVAALRAWATGHATSTSRTSTRRCWPGCGRAPTTGWVDAVRERPVHGARCRRPRPRRRPRGARRARLRRLADGRAGQQLRARRPRAPRSAGASSPRRCAGMARPRAKAGARA